MASLGELISYQPNKDLGLGSNADVPVSYDKPLEFTNQVLRDVAAREFQKNILRYKKQLDDRDKMYEALSSGEVKTGDILERDMPTVRTALDKQTNAFKEWMKKGYGDTDGALAYKKATQEANDAATQAQARKVFYDKESGVIGKEGIPKYATARKANLEKSLQNFWGDIQPFQETSRLNLEPIEKFAAPITEEFRDPAKPLEKGKRTYFSYDDTLKKSSQYSLTPEGLFNLGTFQQALTELAPVELIDKIKTVNKELDRYNKERGLVAGVPDFASPIQVVQLPNGKLGINEPVDKLAAKFSLAGQQKFKAETTELDEGALKLRKQAADERHDKATEGIGWYNAKTGRLNAERMAAASGTSQEMANSAKSYAEALADKLNKLKDKGGVITSGKFSKLTQDELKYMGSALTEENKFSLTPLDLKGITSIVIDDDGTIKFFEGGTTSSLGTQKGQSIKPTTIALNKLGDEMSITSGKEGYNFNNLVSLYDGIKSGGDVEKELSTDVSDWKQEGNNWRYKDGRLFDAKGNEVKK